MKRLICTTVFALLTVFTAQGIRAEKLEVGAKFDIEKLGEHRNDFNNTIVVFMPSLTYDCDYASMLTQSFYYYFDRGLAFEGEKHTPVVRVFLVVGDSRNEAKSTQNILGEMNTVFDEKGEIFAHFGVNSPASKNADSTLLLLDSNEKITHIDPSYRAQGEHLKPLENKIRELNGIALKANIASAPKRLKVGDKAPDFLIRDNQKLSDLRGEVVLVSFYPAAFSGTFPRPVEVVPAALALLRIDSARSPLSGITFDSGSLMSCSFQLDAIDIKPRKVKKEAKRIVVSSSTGSLLENWRKALGTRNITYANDPDYSISGQYSSYNPAGYNNRVSVIIDKKGRIAYIDESFDVNDEIVLNAKIDALTSKK